MSRDKDIINAAYQISLREGLGSGSSCFISGSRPVHKSLEQKLAKWIDKEKVLLFPSGFQANIAAIQSLADRKSIVIADKYIHNSLITGVKASGAKLVRFLHNNVNDLEKKLEQFTKNNIHILVIVESIYSMEGSIAPLDKIANLCQRYQTELLVDEAHALGILGPTGRGLSIKFKNLITIVSGTFGKSFGSGGAFLACNSEISERIIQVSGAFRYTTALSPALAAGAINALKKFEKNTTWSSDLIRISKKWKDEIQKIKGFQVIGDCHILSIVIGEEDKTLSMQKYLEDNGFLAVAIRPPTVPRGESRIRLTISKTLNDNILKKFIEVLKAYK